MTPFIDFDPKPDFIRPEILCSPQIPPPMWGVAPRTVNGEEWWNNERKYAYERNNHCCWACGAHAPLAAHEVFEIDFMERRMTFKEVTALCEDCHNFIHLGRSAALLLGHKKDMTEWKFSQLIKSRYRLLKQHKLKPNWAFYATLKQVYTYPSWRPRWVERMLKEETLPPPARMEPWGEWRMVYDGKYYKPKYQNETEARAAYYTEE